MRPRLYGLLTNDGASTGQKFRSSCCAFVKHMLFITLRCRRTKTFLEHLRDNSMAISLQHGAIWNISGLQMMLGRDHNSQAGDHHMHGADIQWWTIVFQITSRRNWHTLTT